MHDVVTLIVYAGGLLAWFQSSHLFSSVQLCQAIKKTANQNHHLLFIYLFIYLFIIPSFIEMTYRMVSLKLTVKCNFLFLALSLFRLLSSVSAPWTAQLEAVKL